MSNLSQRIANLSPLKLALAAQQVTSTLGLLQAEPIAVIGLGCRFPKAANPQAYWQLLRQGIDAIAEVPRDRWDIEAFYDPDPEAAGKMYTRYGGFLSAVDGFDPEFFGIAPREAYSLDPQQRLLLEVAWEALEMANQVPDQLYGSATGVFVGICTSDYAKRLLGANDPARIDAYYGTGNALSVAAGRLSYTLGLTGPSLSVDTACSSSLVAVHLACQSLRQRECHLALAGGVNLMLSPENTITFSRARMMAPDGRCKTFDASANGYGRGEGCGVVVLKRFADAVADGDAILALIRGSAVNQDGPSGGLTVPNGPSQQAVIRQALASGGVDPAQISYIEAHGTGTALGDPIEVGALGAVFGPQHSPDHPLWIGSAKTNIGHLEGAAGIAGLIKVVLSLQHREIPPHLHFQQPSPHIPWAQLPFRVPTQLTPWPEGQRQLAGVSSFGFSGTNAHIILEAAPELPVVPEPLPCPERPLHLVPLSAQSEPALRQLLQAYVAWLQAHPEVSLGDLAFTASTGRRHGRQRLALTAADAEQLRTQLQAIATDPAPIVGPSTPPSPPKLAMLFTGQGSQYPGMGRDLYETQPLFRQQIDRCAEILAPHLETPLVDLLYRETDPQTWNQPLIVQPLLFALEYALAQLWLSWGVKPDAVFGHSLGEYVAACVAGCLTLEDSLIRVVERARLMQSLGETGTMAAVFADAETVTQAIAEFPETLSLAALNGPANTVVAGRRADLETVLEQLQARGIDSKPLEVSHGFHSPLLEPILDAFEAQLQASEAASQPPHIPLVANLTGDFWGADQPLDSRYWRRHTREPVQFARAIATLQATGHTLFLEIGPHPILCGMGKRCLADDAPATTWLPSLRRGQPDWQRLLTSLGQLYCRGVAIDWRAYDRPYRRRPLSLPTYPFQRQRYWLEVPGLAPTAPATPAAAVPAAAYRLDWQPGPLAPALAPAAGAWIICSDRQGIGTALAQELTARGQRVVQAVTAAPRGAPPLPSAAITVDPADGESWQRLWAHCRQTLGEAAPTLVYLWSLDLPSGTGGDPLTTLGQPLLQTLQALLQAPWRGRLPLWLVSRGAQGVITAPSEPLQGFVWGLGRVLRLEHPELWGGLIDVDPQAAPPATARWLAEQLLAADGEDEVAWRGGDRYVARLVSPALSPAATARVAADGTYLITGGTGALGLVAARWLADQGAKSLVLVSRRGETQAVAPVLADLRSRGLTVAVEAVDLADGPAVQALISRLPSRLPLKGVIHAAGVLVDGVLAHQSWEQFEAVLQPKVRGALNLHQALGDSPPDWVLLFSSAASLLGSPGQGNYAAANAVLDSLAQQWRQQGLAATSIGWGPWAETGMAQAQTERAANLARRGLQGLPPAVGLAYLNALTQPTAGHVAIAAIDWARVGEQLAPDQRIPAIAAWLPTGAPPPSRPQPPVMAAADAVTRDRRRQQWLALPLEARSEALETYLATAIGQVSGRQEPAPVDRPLLDLGIDSLMVMDLLNLCRQDLHLSLYPREILAHPTIRDLARYMARELASGTPSASPDQALATAAPAAPSSPASPAGFWSHTRPLAQPPAQKNAPAVFLLSSPRAGSTLLRVMLAGHADLFCPPELHLLPFDTLGERQQRLGDTYLQEGLQRALMALMDLDAQQSEALLGEWTEHQLSIQAVYDKLQQLAGSRLLVDKSPTYGLNRAILERGEQLFAGAKYIHLVRHPYAVIDSFVRNRMHKIFDLASVDPYQVAEQVWNGSNRHIADFLADIDPARRFFLRYEDLVADPEAALRRLCDFLGVPFDPAVLTPYQGDRMTDGVRSQSLAVDDPNFKQHRRIEPELADAWRHLTLPRPLGADSRSLAAQLGYDLPAEPSPEPSRQPLATMQETQVVVRGLTLTLCQWGPPQGRPILCLHGILQHGAAWDGIASRLGAAGYRVTAPDLRGHGRSDHAGPGGSYQLIEFLADLQVLVQQHLQTPLGLVGHSMGAVLAAALAATNPAAIGQLVLIEPVVPEAGPSLEPAQQLAAQLTYLVQPPQHQPLASVAAAADRLRQFTPALAPETALQLAARLTTPCGAGVQWRWDPRLQARSQLGLGDGLFDRDRYRQLLQGLTLPTTLIFGRQSQFNRAADRDLQATALATARRLDIEGGHNLPEEAPAAIAPILLEQFRESIDHG